MKLRKEKHLNSRETIERIKKELDEALSRRVGDEDLIYRLNNELIAAYKAEEEFWATTKQDYLASFR